MTVATQSKTAMNRNHFNYLQDSFFRTQVVKDKKVHSCCSMGPFSRRFVVLAAWFSRGFFAYSGSPTRPPRGRGPAPSPRGVAAQGSAPAEAAGLPRPSSRFAAVLSSINFAQQVFAWLVGVYIFFLLFFLLSPSRFPPSPEYFLAHYSNKEINAGRPGAGSVPISAALQILFSPCWCGLICKWELLSTGMALRSL